MSAIKWWEYLHVSGTVHVKQYYGPEDLTEAHESPFVRLVFGPWDCAERFEAEKLLRAELEKLDRNGVGA